jgi:hypothetical protein
MPLSKPTLALLFGTLFTALLTTAADGAEPISYFVNLHIATPEVEISGNGKTLRVAYGKVPTQLPVGRYTIKGVGSTSTLPAQTLNAQSRTATVLGGGATSPSLMSMKLPSAPGLFVFNAFADQQAIVVNTKNARRTVNPGSLSSAYPPNWSGPMRIEATPSEGSFEILTEPVKANPNWISILWLFGGGERGNEATLTFLPPIAPVVTRASTVQPTTAWPSCKPYPGLEQIVTGNPVQQTQEQPVTPTTKPTRRTASSSSVFTLQFDALGIKTPVLRSTGIKAGELTVDVDNGARPSDVHWFTQSNLPGTGGTSIVIGHVNWKNERGPFLQIALGKTPKPGSPITIVIDDKLVAYEFVEKITFKKTDLIASPLCDPDRSDGSTLYLVTCGGDVYTGKDGRYHYDSNVVIVARQLL